MTEQAHRESGKGYELKVNGIQFESESQFMTANQILELAAEKGAIPGKVGDYALEGEKGRYTGDKEVDLEQDNIFITIPITPTPVA